MGEVIRYQISDAATSVDKRKNELKTLVDNFELQRLDGIVHVILITGTHLTEKLALADNFAYDLYKNKQISCIKLDGLELEYEFKKPCKEICGIKFESISELSIWFGTLKWILILTNLKADNQKSIEYLKNAILQLLFNIPPHEGPFLIVISEDRHMESILVSFNYLRYSVIR